MTDAWIDRLQVLHADVKATEDRARALGKRTALSGVFVAFLGALTAVVVVRSTARSITGPVARLATDATRLGEGNFAPIAAVGGPLEIEGLRRNLERTREKLLGVDRLKQAFLASVSHELRSPLGRLREAVGHDLVQVFIGTELEFSLRDSPRVEPKRVGLDLPGCGHA